MKKIGQCVLYCFFLMIANSVFAGSASIMLKCYSGSGKFSINGILPGDALDFNLEIAMNDKILSYQYGCVDAGCTTQANKGKLYIVNAIKNRVFTIAFFRKGKRAGDFYAIPSSVKYQKTTYGYRAKYSAVYNGLDPRSNLPLVKPVLLKCMHIYEM